MKRSSDSARSWMIVSPPCVSPRQSSGSGSRCDELAQRAGHRFDRRERAVELVADHAHEPLPRLPLLLAQRPAEIRDHEQLVRLAAFAETAAPDLPAARSRPGTGASRCVPTLRPASRRAPSRPRSGRGVRLPCRRAVLRPRGSRAASVAASRTRTRRCRRRRSLSAAARRPRAPRGAGRAACATASSPRPSPRPSHPRDRYCGRASCSRLRAGPRACSRATAAAARPGERSASSPPAASIVTTAASVQRSADVVSHRHRSSIASATAARWPPWRAGARGSESAGAFS